MRNREKQRDLFKEQNFSEKRDMCGKKDLTPYNAIQIIKGKSVGDIVLR